MSDIDKILEDVDANAWRHAETVLSLASEVRRLRADIKRLRLACSKANDEISQILGKALGYPWFKDDQKNFPGATEANGVCVGDHVAESLADEAARRIGEMRAKLVEAAIEIARISWLEYGVATSTCIESARSKYGTRLQFWDGRFEEEK